MLRGVVMFLQLLVLALSVSADASGPANKHVQPRSTSKRQFGLPAATWGPDVTMGQTTSEYIALSTVYSTGPPPANVKGSIFLWPGLFDQANRNGGDLIQTVIELHPPKDLTKTCGAKPGQWCIRPFVVNYRGNPQLSNTPDRGVAFDPNDKLLIEYSKAAGLGGKWSQKITNLSKGGGKPYEFKTGQPEYIMGNTPTRWLQIATEYQGGNTGTASEQNYWNTTLTVRDPEPGLGAKFHTHGKIDSTKPYTKDGGKTWVIDKVTIPAKLPGTEWKGP